MQKSGGHCKTPIKVIHSFLNVTGANWRNSIYIDCPHCKYDKEDLCSTVSGFLMIPDTNGIPLMLPVSDAEILFARRLDKSECLLRISNLLFQEIYKPYVTQHCEVNTRCPMVQIWRKQNS